MTHLRNTESANLTFESVLKTSWELSKDCRTDLFIASVIVAAIGLVVFALLSIVLESLGAGMIGGLISGALSSGVLYVLWAGLIHMGIERVRGNPISIGMALSQTDKAPTLFVAGLLAGLLTNIGFILLIIPGIFLSVAFYLTTAVIVDKNPSATEALKLSFYSVTKRWFAVAILFFILGLIMGISAIPLFIGLYWTLPLMIIAVAVVYTRMNDEQTNAL